MPQLLVMAAGSGGHIIPGLAVAREAQRRGWDVSWLGTAAGIENRLVPPTGIPLDLLAFSGLRGKGALGALSGSARLVQGFAQAGTILRRRKPDVVLGMGGYVCVPGGVMARVLGKPLVLVNADAALLLSNKALLGITNTVAFGFDGAAAARTRHAVVTGNPVRAEIEAIAPPEERFRGRSGPLRVLVFGGSLGAKVLNDTVPAALALLPAAERPNVIHQTGHNHVDGVRARYAELGVTAEIAPFIDDMASQLAAADLVLCRAGAISISELCVAGVASALVPLIVSTTTHQRENAEYLAGHHAAFHLPQAQLTAADLAGVLQRVTRDELLTMAQAARKLARRHAAARVTDELEKLLR
ncbi:MAG: undecaprenyldiphospho-muramoylpentapeptide beta-N-acetylglucosaminyltransferase [Polyangiales bacterium]